MTQSLTRPVLEGISPVLAVADIAVAIEYYCKALGFELDWKAGDPATHANVCRDRIDITLTQNAAKAGSGDVYIQVSDVDGYLAELTDRRVAVGPIGNRDYGMRDFLVEDPDGNRLVFGQSTA